MECGSCNEMLCEYLKNKNNKLTKNTPAIKPNNPIALPKISIIKILTKSEEFAASAIAAPDPTTPTQRPHTRFIMPTVSPEPNIT